jgi:hypothetical protein
LVKALRLHFEALNFFIYKEKRKNAHVETVVVLFKRDSKFVNYLLPFSVKCYVVLHLDHVLNVWQLVRRFPLVTKKRQLLGINRNRFPCILEKKWSCCTLLSMH